MNPKPIISFVLFGATGNLALLKVLPALCALLQSGVIGSDIKIIGFGRREWGDCEYRNFIQNSLSKFEPGVVDQFLSNVHFVQGAFDDKGSYIKLKEKIDPKNAFYYLAVLPDFYETIIQTLGETGLKGKVMIEKPFGNSSRSAEKLENFIEKYFDENDIVRIDHYLGEKGVQAIAAKRKEDPQFESLLTNENVSRVICRLREVIDIAGRGDFYDKTGAFLDVAQNHALEIVATLFASLAEDPICARADFIETLEFVPRSLIRAQYEGYKEEKGVAAGSETETYIRFAIQSTLPALSGIEIVIEAGKALEMSERKKELVIEYVDQTQHVFNIDMPKGYNAYEEIVGSALKGQPISVGKRETIALWKLADEILSHKNDTPLIFYKKGNGPEFTH